MIIKLQPVARSLINDHRTGYRLTATINTE
jgi:hypothetical protein